MSVLNNRDTLLQFEGNIWLTRPQEALKGKAQKINVCYELNGDFAAIGSLSLEFDGNYYHKNHRIGKIGDVVFAEFIRREYPEATAAKEPDKIDIAGFESDDELYDKIAEIYSKSKNVKQLSAITGYSQSKIKKILITKGVFESEQYKKIKILLAEGKSIEQIQDELKIAKKNIRAYFPYDSENAQSQETNP